MSPPDGSRPPPDSTFLSLSFSSFSSPIRSTTP
jgi:hypothetical protein